MESNKGSFRSSIWMGGDFNCSPEKKKQQNMAGWKITEFSIGNTVYSFYFGSMFRDLLVDPGV